MVLTRQILRSVWQVTQKRGAKYRPEIPFKLEGVYDNEFNRQREAVRRHAQTSTELWRRMTWYVVPAAILITATNTWARMQQHHDHMASLPPMDERPQYSYLNVRTKKYPWGDGNKTLFWNDKVNYIPDWKKI